MAAESMGKGVNFVVGLTLSVLIPELSRLPVLALSSELLQDDSISAKHPNAQI